MRACVRPLAHGPLGQALALGAPHDPNVRSALRLCCTPPQYCTTGERCFYISAAQMDSLRLRNGEFRLQVRLRPS